MTNGFSDIGVSAPILKALDDMGFEVPTEVQRMAIPHILDKQDLIVKSKTGSGKTAVFGVSVLQMADPDAKEPQGLILTPTRELAVQIDDDIKQMSKYLPHKTLAVYGQHSINTEIQALNKGVSIVTGTPGRISDHICHGNLKTRNIRFLVLDEADRMLDMGFLEQVVRIIKSVPKERITLLFSATIPTDIHRICRDYMKNPLTIEIDSPTKTVDTIKQVHYRVNNNEKNIKLNLLLLTEQPDSCIIFCNTRITVDRVQIFLSRKGYLCKSLHGDIPQAKRMKTIEQFKNGDFHILIATDVAARGIHVDGLSLVINYDVPVEKDSYVHRIGRTGRAGNAGYAITFATSDDIMSLYEIEEHIGAMIPEEEFAAEIDLDSCRAAADKWIKENVIKNSLVVKGAKTPYSSEHTKNNNSKKHKSVSDNVRMKSNKADTSNINKTNHKKSPAKAIDSKKVVPEQTVKEPVIKVVTPINTSSNLNRKVTRTVHVGKNSNAGNPTELQSNNVRKESIQNTPKSKITILTRLLRFLSGKN